MINIFVFYIPSKMELFVKEDASYDCGDDSAKRIEECRKEWVSHRYAP